MRTNRFILGILIALCACTTLQAQVSEDTLVLLPIYTGTISGAYGSEWVTDFFIRNDGDQPVSVTPLECDMLCVGRRTLPPRQDADWSPRNQDRTFAGRVLRMPRAESTHVVFSLRVRDISRQARSAGTEVPVVREADLSQRLVLLNVPVDARFRHSLRIYDLSTSVAPVRLRVFAAGNPTPLVDETITLLQPPYTVDGVIPAQTGIHGLVDAYPQLATSTRVRVEIDATDGTQRLWAFVTTTNNETQEFTTNTPQ